MCKSYAILFSYDTTGHCYSIQTQITLAVGILFLFSMLSIQHFLKCVYHILKSTTLFLHINASSLTPCL